MKFFTAVFVVIGFLLATVTSAEDAGGGPANLLGSGTTALQGEVVFGEPVKGWEFDDRWLGGNVSMAATGGAYGGGLWIDVPETGDPSGRKVNPGLNRLAVAKLKQMGITSFRAPQGLQSSWYDPRCGAARAGQATPTCPALPLDEKTCHCDPPRDDCPCDRCTGDSERENTADGRGCFQVLARDGVVDRLHPPHRYPFGSCELVKLMNEVAGDRAVLTLTVSPFPETYDPSLRFHPEYRLDRKKFEEVLSRHVVPVAVWWVKLFKDECGFKGKILVEIGNEPWGVGGYEEPEYFRKRVLGQPPVRLSAKGRELYPIQTYWYVPSRLPEGFCKSNEECVRMGLDHYAKAAAMITSALRKVDKNLPVGIDSYEVRAPYGDRIGVDVIGEMLNAYETHARPAMQRGTNMKVDFLVTHRYWPNPRPDYCDRPSRELFLAMMAAPKAMMETSFLPIYDKARAHPSGLFTNAELGITEYAPGILGAPRSMKHSLASALQTADIILSFLQPPKGSGNTPRVWGHHLALADWQGKCPDEMDSGTGLLRLKTSLLQPGKGKHGCPEGFADDPYGQKISVPFVRQAESYVYELLALLREKGAVLTKSHVNWKTENAPVLKLDNQKGWYRLPVRVEIPAARVLGFETSTGRILLILNRHPERALSLRFEHPGGKEKLLRWSISAPSGDVWASGWNATSDEQSPVRLAGPEKSSCISSGESGKGGCVVKIPSASLFLLEIPTK